MQGINTKNIIIQKFLYYSKDIFLYIFTIDRRIEDISITLRLLIIVDNEINK